VSQDLKHLKLVDFNVARNLQGGLALTPTGTKLYAAPEVVFGESPSELSDIWAVGLCAHMLLTGKLPQGRDVCESCMKPVSKCAERAVSLRGPHWAMVSEQCKAMLRRCLATEPAERRLPIGCDDALLVGCCGSRTHSLPLPVPAVARHGSGMSEQPEISSGRSTTVHVRGQEYFSEEIAELASKLPMACMAYGKSRSRSSSASTACTSSWECEASGELRAPSQEP